MCEQAIMRLPVHGRLSDGVTSICLTFVWQEAVCSRLHASNMALVLKKW